MESGGDQLFSTLLMITAFFMIFYFLLIRPEQKKRQEHEEKVSKLKKGDKVIVAGGIYATLIGIKDDVAAVKVGENMKIEVQKQAIIQILDGSEKK